MNDNRFFEARVRDIAIEATSLRAPANAWGQITARIQDGDAVVLPVATPVQSRRPQVRVAAVVMFVIAAAAAAATIPGSPLREWIAKVRTERPAVPRAPVIPPVPAVVEPAQSTTFIVLPVNGLVTVAFLNPGDSARVHVRFTDQPDVAVRATGSAANAIFRSADGRLTIAELNAGDLEIVIPGSLSRIRMEVDGRVYLTKSDDRIQVLAPTADTVGSEFVLPIGKD